MAHLKNNIRFQATEMDFIIVSPEIKSVSKPLDCSKQHQQYLLTHWNSDLELFLITKVFYDVRFGCDFSRAKLL